MKEELYILLSPVRGEWGKLDLGEKNSIILKYCSNIFVDLSKISASHSYTFKLPMTANNRRVLNMADDIRCSSSIIYRKYRGLYVQNGISLLENVNLYIDSIDTAYRCVMTWNDAMIFSQIQEDNLKLNELTDFDNKISWISIEGKIDQFDNNKILNNVVYNAGVNDYNFYFDVRVGQNRRNYNIPFIPVVPVYAILEAVAKKYKFQCDIAKSMTYSNWTDEEDLFDCVNKGVIPLVGHQLSMKQYAEYAVTLYALRFNSSSTINGRFFKNIIYFSRYEIGNKIDYTEGNGYFYTTKDSYGVNGFSVGWGVKVKITGCLQVEFSDLGNNYETPIMKLCYSYYESSQYRWNDIVEVKGRRGLENPNLWEFDFRDTTSSVPLEYENAAGVSESYKFWFSHTISLLKVSEKIMIVPVGISDDGIFTGSSNPMVCLPETSVLDFLKSLLFMTGTFPVFKNNTLSAVGYDVFQKNIENGNVYDWDKKLIGFISQLPTKTSFVVGNYAKRNYFAMSTDNTGDDESSDSKDVYQKGLAEFSLSSSLISTKEKTVAKLPWAAPYLLNRESPNEKTGDTIKSWALNNDASIKYNTPKPSLGVIIQRSISHTDYDGNTIDDGKVMSMRIWNDFSKVLQSQSMKYLQQVINKPIVITENFELNEFDLRDMDFTVPVYLNKYNAYFAILSVTRDSEGICKCELIKLP